MQKQNVFYDKYLSNAPIGHTGGPSEEKIIWNSHNFSKFFPGRDKSYLDIGPGQGEDLILWKRLGFKKIYAIDISKEVCEHINKIGFSCKHVKDSTEFLKLNPTSYDLIMLNDVMEHIPKVEIVQFTQAIYKSLRPKGVVIIKSPNAQSPHFAIGRYGDITHIQSFTESSLLQLLTMGGFKKINFFAENHPVPRTYIKGLIAKYIIEPAYYWYVRKIRQLSFQASPRVLTQAIIAVATK